MILNHIGIYFILLLILLVYILKKRILFSLWDVSVLMDQMITVGISNVLFDRKILSTLSDKDKHWFRLDTIKKNHVNGARNILNMADKVTFHFFKNSQLISIYRERNISNAIEYSLPAYSYGTEIEISPYYMYNFSNTNHKR